MVLAGCWGCWIGEVDARSVRSRGAGPKNWPPCLVDSPGVFSVAAGYRAFTSVDSRGASAFEVLGVEEDGLEDRLFLRPRSVLRLSSSSPLPRRPGPCSGRTHGRWSQLPAEDRPTLMLYGETGSAPSAARESRPDAVIAGLNRSC